MKAYTKRDLNQRTAEVLDAAGTRDPVVITERDGRRWKIWRADEEVDPLVRARAEGRTIGPKDHPAPFPALRSGPGNPQRVDDLLDELRGDH
ncbi:MAG: hypothetical protein ACTMHH_07680 [Nesterenkonia sp.]